MTALAGCGGGGPPTNHDPGPPTLSATGALTMALTFGEVTHLSVVYLDAKRVPLAGATVGFAIWRDPGGSTLATDHAVTDDSGVAGVDVTAGAADVDFEVRVTADGADPVSFDITVSQDPVAALDVRLAATPQEKASTLVALLYSDLTCEKLPPVAVPPTPLHSVSATGPSADLAFPDLLARSYAVVGRASDTAGHLVAYGCVDVDVSQLLPGSTVALSLPLAALPTTPASSYRLAIDLPVTAAASPIGTWEELSACAQAPAQPILDAIVDELTPSGTSAELVAAMQNHRGPVDAHGCRPATLGGQPTLDAGLNALITKTGSPGAALLGVVADLHAIVADARLSSTLAIAANGPATSSSYLGQHTLSQLSFTGATPGATITYSLPDAGVPIVSAEDVGLVVAAATSTAPPTLTLAEHGFTLRLPRFWGLALVDLALAPRSLPLTPRDLLGSVIKAASRGSGAMQLVGCAAVEDLVCATVGSAVTGCALASACEQALDAMGQGLSAVFAPPSGIDFMLSGIATLTDGNGDHVGETLSAGTFKGGVTVVAPGTQTPVNGTFTGAANP